ncbi:MAG: lipopolysaccharide heptosyltransferase II [Gammaproteobacteria bacterium RIFCSPHIGHO2_12_FULL_41_20]|nr:MAG: lipopolysaccharide heptosyltransferase II [Gammaproteobacteria bacterium RIFCSPHIGHO2_12_FULL_41_20]
MRKMLVIGPAWVGDMVMAQSLFMLLKQREPDLVIDVLAPAWSAPILGRMSEVSAFVEMPITHGELKLGERFRIAQSLREKRYDQAIVLPNSFKSALIPWWARIPKRTGWARELRSLILNDVRYLDEKRYPLMIERFMALALPADDALPQPYPYPALRVSAESQRAVLNKYEIARPTKPVLALCPGAEFGPAKRWPEEYFVRIAMAKLYDDWDVWLFGSPKEKTIADMIMQQTQQQCLDLVGRTRLEEVIDLLSLATGVISNDSGLMHIAAALQKPLLAIYGPTSPHFTPPLTAQAQILRLSLDCQPCFQRTCPLQHHRCMRDLTPEKILTAMAKWGPVMSI